MSGDEPIDLGRFVIPPGELEWRFDTAGGPGGQHANRASTRAELAWNLAESTSVPDDLRQRMLQRLGHRVVDGEVRVAASESRSQWRNRAIARSRLANLLADALAPPPPKRRPTNPSRSAKRRRLEAKRRRSEKKDLRKPPTPE